MRTRLYLAKAFAVISGKKSTGYSLFDGDHCVYTLVEKHSVLRYWRNLPTAWATNLPTFLI